jgi:YHS domain-containing protein
MPIVDPVTNVEIDDVEYPELFDYEGHTYAFASMDTLHEFQKEPARYADPSKAVSDDEK